MGPSSLRGKESDIVCRERGLGILLVIVVVVGWKCTPQGHEPLHALFGIGNFRHGRHGGQTRERRRRRHRNRDGNWYGGVLYPEFQYRRPPPSYAASMQDYQNQQLQHGGGDADRRSGQPAGSSSVPYPGGAENSSLPNSPPPSYRSRASTAHSGIHIAFPAASSSGNAGSNGTHDGELPGSRPPTYRSRAPSRRPSLPRNDMPDNNNDGGDVDFGDGQIFDAVVAAEQVSGEASQPVDGASTSPSSSHSAAEPATSSSSSPHSPGSVTLQVYTLPTVRAENQNPSSALPPSLQSQAIPSVSGARTSSSTVSDNLPAFSTTVTTVATTGASSMLPSSSSHHASTGVPFTSAVAPPPTRLPSLHQRMESGDRRMLEDTLQSLEDHIDSHEGGSSHGGIVNLAASFDSEEPTEHYNTHL
ncbi:tRNA pseudouridine synthase A [Elysia marginata]|uniref:tRNA pseudouridine synthase A n=1 Tax=Elysia marginata TaxID=1093978 RepID=A0AAV4HGA3_9GAST|nr:tRNA pseudouridine synthase A [Elysia marginata]